MAEIKKIFYQRGTSFGPDYHCVGVSSDGICLCEGSRFGAESIDGHFLLIEKRYASKERNGGNNDFHSEVHRGIEIGKWGVQEIVNLRLKTLANKLLDDIKRENPGIEVEVKGPSPGLL